MVVKNPDGTTIDVATLKDLSEILSDGQFALDGEAITVDTLRQSRDRGKNLEKDYTKKTQDLANQRRDLEKQVSDITNKGTIINIEKGAQRLGNGLLIRRVIDC